MLAHYSCGAVVLCLFPVAAPAGDGKFLTCRICGLKWCELSQGKRRTLASRIGCSWLWGGLEQAVGQLCESCMACTAVRCSLCLAVMISMMCCWHSNTFPAESSSHKRHSACQLQRGDRDAGDKEQPGSGNACFLILFWAFELDTDSVCKLLGRGSLRPA